MKFNLLILEYFQNREISNLSCIGLIFLKKKKKSMHVFSPKESVVIWKGRMAKPAGSRNSGWPNLKKFLFIPIPILLFFFHPMIYT